MKITIDVYPSKEAIFWLTNIEITNNGQFKRYLLPDGVYWEVRNYVERKAGSYFLNKEGIAIRNHFLSKNFEVPKRK